MTIAFTLLFLHKSLHSKPKLSCAFIFCALSRSTIIISIMCRAQREFFALFFVVLLACIIQNENSKGAFHSIAALQMAHLSECMKRHLLKIEAGTPGECRVMPAKRKYDSQKRKTKNNSNKNVEYKFEICTSPWPFSCVFTVICGTHSECVELTNRTRTDTCIKCVGFCCWLKLSTTAKMLFSEQVSLLGFRSFGVCAQHILCAAPLWYFMSWITSAA